jgi:peptidoglycan/LPS O-acetylase OafA/YrhL
MPNLDLLRSIAVLLVAVEHTLLALRVVQLGYWTIQWMGVVGVFMFFVHTSLVLMWSIDRAPNTMGFYVRRIFRIYPLSVVVIGLTVIFHIPTMQNIWGATYFQTGGSHNVASNLLLVQNLFGAGNILGVMWTLPLEVDMYFLLPFLYFFLRKNFSVWPVLALWFFAAAYDRTTFPADVSTFAMCIPIFLPGVMAWLLFARIKPRLPAFLMPCLVAGLLAGFMVRPNFRSGWLVAMALGLALPWFRQIRMKWLIRVSHAVAQYSYGIYLIHPFSIALGINYLHGYSMAVRMGVLIASLVVVVVALHHAVEKPMMQLGARLARKIERPVADAVVS